ncbi:MAG: TlpA disulfide reductase family protein [Pirellulales bacterium]
MKGPAARLLTEADKDLKAQAGRTSALDKLRKEQVGRTLEKFQIAGLDGAALASEELADAVTVLHFWDYRDEPLKEPYGQVGYLEFLYDQHKEAGLKLYGVAVDTRFAQPESARTAAVGVRKFKNFMNLSYPILFDAGDLIRTLGDPRLQGGELPLFVVIGRDGKIAHYKVGHYAVDREAGLAQLNGVVKELLEAGSKEPAKP